MPRKTVIRGNLSFRQSIMANGRKAWVAYPKGERSIHASPGTIYAASGDDNGFCVSLRNAMYDARKTFAEALDLVVAHYEAGAHKSSFVRDR